MPSWATPVLDSKFFIFSVFNINWLLEIINFYFSLHLLYLVLLSLPLTYSEICFQIHSGYHFQLLSLFAKILPSCWYLVCMLCYILNLDLFCRLWCMRYTTQLNSPYLWRFPRILFIFYYGHIAKGSYIVRSYK